jgi:hypothetical protein
MIRVSAEEFAIDPRLPVCAKTGGNRKNGAPNFKGPTSKAKRTAAPVKRAAYHGF